MIFAFIAQSKIPFLYHDDKTNDHVSTTNLIRILQYELLFLNIEIYYSNMGGMRCRMQSTMSRNLKYFVLLLHPALCMKLAVGQSDSKLT